MESLVKPPLNKDRFNTISSIIILELQCWNILKKIIKNNLTHGQEYIEKKFYIWEIIEIKEKAICIGPFIGAPAFIMGLEYLYINGIKKYNILGTAGSINSQFKIGDIVLPIKAFSEEGVSRHYLERDTLFIENNNIKEISALLKRNQINYKKGIICSTDAPYRETWNKILEWKNKKIDCIDMEISALFSFVDYYKDIKIFPLLIISDELFSGKWKKGFSNKKFKDSIKIICNLFLNKGL